MAEEGRGEQEGGRGGVGIAERWQRRGERRGKQEEGDCSWLLPLHPHKLANNDSHLARVSTYIGEVKVSLQVTYPNAQLQALCSKLHI